MKKYLAIGLALAAASIAAPRAGAVDISAGVQINVPGVSAGVQIGSPTDFYQPLSPYGSWINFSTYGRCWHPTDVSADWRPYSNGSWEWTDAGWYWQSDEPWAWATYHYGSWYYDTGYGWIWIPGTEWAPSWVVWRDSDDYIGWAPCGPNMSVLGPSFFMFTPIGDFGGHFGPHNLIINNTRIIDRTRLVKDFSRQSMSIDGRRQNVFVNRGPGLDRIQRATRRQFTARPVGEVMRQTRENARQGRNQPEQQRFNNEQQNRQQRLNQQPNRETPPPTGREQPRQFQQPRQQNQPQRPNEQPNRVTPPPTGREQPRQNEQPNRVTPPPTGREQPRQFEQPRQQPEQRTPQQPEQRQLQRPEQQRPEATPPTGRGQERMYNQQPSQEHRQETPAPEQRATPAQRATPPERSTPAERSAPSQGAAPAERALPPTGRQNTPPSGHEAAPPAQRPETRPAPEQHGPAQAPGQQRKDPGDQGQ